MTYPRRDVVEKALGLGPIQKVQYRPKKPNSRCYWNVDEAVAEGGGTAVYGWELLLWPKVYIRVRHHAVWRRKDGRLLDVTMKFEPDDTNYTPFLPDPNAPQDLTRGFMYPDKFFPLSRDPLVTAVIETYRREQAYAVEVSRVSREAGYVFDPNVGMSVSSEADRQLKAMMVDRSQAVANCRAFGPH